MDKWKVVYTSQAKKDAKKLKKSGLKDNAEKLLKLIEDAPFVTPPKYHALFGDLAGCFSRNISYQHRLVYQVYEELKTIKVIRMWTHYE